MRVTIFGLPDYKKRVNKQFLIEEVEKVITNVINMKYLTRFRIYLKLLTISGITHGYE